MSEKDWSQLKIPTSLYKRIEALIEKRYKGDYGKTGGVPEFVREAVRLRLNDLGAYAEDDGEDVV